MLRDALFLNLPGRLNVDVGAVVGRVYVEVKGVEFDPGRDALVLKLDQAALEKAVTAARRGISGEDR